MSPSLDNLEKPHYPGKRTHSPAHIMDQALSVAPLRKPIKDNNPNNSSSSNLHPSDPRSDASTPTINAPNNGHNGTPTTANKYEFDTTPTPSARNSYRKSYIDPAMDPSVRLEEYDWPELETQFAARMEAFKAVEEGIWEEWREWGEVFKAWASTISVHDEERASKRLRTRIAYTQGSEEGLEAKRVHCEFLSRRRLGGGAAGVKKMCFAPLSDIGKLRSMWLKLEKVGWFVVFSWGVEC